MKLLQLSEIWIYPIKSLGGIPVQSAKVFPKGLELDRRWMLVDENNVFMTQREHSKMSLFKLTHHTNQLKIKFDNEELTLPIEAFTSNEIRARVWDDEVKTLEVGDHYSEWFSKMLGFKCKLVFFPEGNPRPVDPDYSLNENNTSLSDAFPFLIIGQSSLDDLNTRLTETVPINRFRPNFVFTGGDPFEEDTWREFSIGDNRFVGVKPCSRCVMLTVNQDTGLKGPEPLKTLATFRQRNNKIYFGQNAIALDYHKVYVGDSINVR